MASITQHAPAYAPTPSRLKSALTKIDQFFTHMAVAISAAQEIKALMNLSDAGLARKGLKRTDIPHYVNKKYFLR
ncbi:MAG: hypothetical protein RIB59_04670 [Rhodospirillales bacterium]